MQRVSFETMMSRVLEKAKDKNFVINFQEDNEEQ